MTSSRLAPSSSSPDAARARLENTYAAAVEESTSLLSIYGHRHAWTTRFNAWLKHADGTPDTPLYDSYRWEDMPTFHFDRETKNPRASVETKTDGAYSGVLELKPGDKLWFTCHVDTTAARAREVELPMPTNSLTYANEATTGEMCILGTVTTDVMLKSIGGKDLLPPSD